MTQDTDPSSNSGDVQGDTTTTAPGSEHPNDTGSGGHANFKDILVGRDGEGNRITQTREIRDVSWEFRPMNYGEVQRYFGDGSQFDVEEEALARLLDAVVVQVDGHDLATIADERATLAGRKARGRVTAEFITEEFLPTALRDVLMAVFEVSGVEADITMDGHAASVEVDEGNPS